MRFILYVQSGIGKGRSDIELRTKGLCKVVIDTKKGKASLVSREFERQYNIDTVLH